MNIRRNLYEIVLSEQEAEEHMKEMIAEGWNVKKQEGELILFLGEDFDNLYEVEYYKETK